MKGDIPSKRAERCLMNDGGETLFVANCVAAVFSEMEPDAQVRPNGVRCALLH